VGFEPTTFGRTSKGGRGVNFLCGGGMAVFWNDPSYAHKPALTPKTVGAIAPTYIYIK
jgi:hypothetical protein